MNPADFNRWWIDGGSMLPPLDRMSTAERESFRPMIERAVKDFSEPLEKELEEARLEAEVAKERERAATAKHDYIFDRLKKAIGEAKTKLAEIKKLAE